MYPKESYRPLDPDADWSFFDPNFHHPSEVRAAIRPLTQESSERFWQLHISSISVERHPKLLKHWPLPTTEGPSWLAEFNDASAAKSPANGAVAKFLRDRFALADQDSIFFVLMREQSYCMPWSAATASWPCLLGIEDEGAMFFHPPSGKFACFGPNGSLAFGVKAPAQGSSEA